MKKPRRNPLVRINPSPCPRVTIPLSNPTPLPVPLVLHVPLAPLPRPLVLHSPMKKKTAAKRMVSAESVVAQTIGRRTVPAISLKLNPNMKNSRNLGIPRPHPHPRFRLQPSPLTSFSPQLYAVRETQFLRIPRDRTPEVSILPSGGHFVSDVARVIYPSYFPFVLCLRSVGCFWICTPGSD